MTSLKDEISKLEREKRNLLKEIEKLEDLKSKDQILEEDYNFQMNKIERQIVEIMDRLVQYRFMNSK